MRIKKIILDHEDKFYWSSKDLHTKKGVIKEEDILNNTSVESNLKKKFKVLPANFQDNLEKINKGPQIPLKKDIASILYYSNIDKDSKVLDAGSGSGLLTINLARIAKEVVSYEKNPKSYEIVKKNIDSLNLKNIKLINKDIRELKEKNFSIITLDLLEPEKILKHIKDSIIKGGTLITYLPNINQILDFKKEIKNHDIIHLKTLETIEREWEINNLVAKPKKQTSPHSGFIVICRKV